MNLDSLDNFKQYDLDNVYGSVSLLAEQVEQAWSEVKSGAFPENCSLAQHIVVTGMGGSALGGRIIKSLTSSTARAPIEIVNEYHLPHYVGSDTLVIISSYSGGTEETISAAEEAVDRKAQIFIVATGGKLAEFAEKHSLPAYIFDPKHNPAGAPRLALGYSIGAVAGVLSRCHFISMTDEAMEEAINAARKFTKEFGVETPETENFAKKFARELKGKMPVLVASEHLVGSAHAFKNQLNESSKAFAVLFDLPELNHHLLEGLRNPSSAKPLLYFLFFESQKYSERVLARYDITKEILKNNDIQSGTYNLMSNTKLEQVFELLTFGSFTQFYLAMLYELNPSPIPSIDFLKKELANL